MRGENETVDGQVGGRFVPIVDAHSADPHYLAPAQGSAVAGRNSVLLLDFAAKLTPNGIPGDLTRVFFLGEARLNGADGNRKQALDALESILAGMGLFLAFLTMVSVVIWLVRAGIEYRRWLRATRIQTDAHMKLVDRLASNDDLLNYMQSAAGQRFLSSTPVAIDASPQAVSAPLNRILWSVQAGVVLTASGIGLWFARFNVIDEAAQALYVIAILTIALGVGFVVSALLSYGLSRQLGLLHTDSNHA